MIHSLSQENHETCVQGWHIVEHLVGSDGSLRPGEEFIQSFKADAVVCWDLLQYGLLGGVEEPIQWEVGPDLQPLTPDGRAGDWTGDSSKEDTELVHHHVGGHVVVRVCGE